MTLGVRALAAIAAGRAAERAALPQVRLADDGAVIVDAALDQGVYEALKRANNDRPTWDRTSRVHRVPPHLAAGLPALAEQAGLRVSDEARAAIAAITSQQEQNRAGASALAADPVPVPGMAAGLALKPQQYPVVRFALAHRRVLIGDDMGWGKTLSSLAAAAAGGAYPAVVVCRPSLTLNWSAEIRRFFPGLVVYEASGTTPHPVPPGTDVIVIGSAALAARPRKTGTGGKQFGWVEELAKTGPRALIVDEGQDTKERTASRSQACEQLAADIIARDGLVLDLTGTAILNRPRELCQQLAMLGRIGDFGGEKKFLWRYCLSETSGYGASYNGARDLIELHDRLRAWGIMIRRSDDAALGLPPCREHVLVVPSADLDPDVMKRYREAETGLLEYLARQAREAAGRLGKDPDSAAVEAAMRAAAAEHLVAINTLRQLAGQAKRGYVTGWVRSRVEAGEKVMVAAHHRPEVDAYAAEFGGLKLQGGQTVAEKEKAKAAFQRKPAAEAPVISVAIGAGGVGHTLTAARIGIQAEQAWTPGETQQMKKRLHRIGQDRAVDYYVTVAEGTIDEQLRAVVTSKQATLDAVLDGRSDSGAAADEASVAAELTWRLTQQGLGNAGPVGPGSAGPVLASAGSGGTAEDAGRPGAGRAAVAAQRALRPDAAASSDGLTAPAPLVPEEAVPAGVVPADGGTAGGDAAGGAEASRESVILLRAGTGRVRAAGTCAVCGTAMTIIEPGQTAHPMCEDDPASAIAAVTGQPAQDDAGDEGEAHAEARVSPQRLREFAHRYLDEGLPPVPAWAATASGECCCPRGAGCGRPGKHPRSVRTGPNAGDYSWKPLACQTHDEIEERFADDSQYAAGNLMVAIPEGMMAIDRDDDDGGRAAVVKLAQELGSLPPTLAHKTPHGEHLLYRIPDGWKGRAWVGKAPGNPVPAGVDLRMPGQILMAAPSVVPGQDGPAGYGPVNTERVAPLPSAYVTAWTPPRTRPAAAPAPAPVPVPVPAASADRAAKYVSDAMTRIAGDLASRGPGGRNPAAYAAGLKAGSLLGAARVTPGAGHAAWTDEQAEQALLDASRRNGYVDKDGEAEALRAIRSGLRNGLRAPRTLPDFSADRAAPAPAPAAGSRPAVSRPPAAGPRGSAAARPPRRPSASKAQEKPGPPAARLAGRWQDLVPGDIGRQVEAADSAAAVRRRAAIAVHQHAIQQHHQAPSPATAAEVERTRAEARAAHQAYTRDGRHIVGRHDAAMLRWAASITAQRERPGPEPGDRLPDMTGSRAAAAAAAEAAVRAYGAGDLDEARRMTEEAAASDPSRESLWQQYREQIDARRAVLASRQAYHDGGGDWRRAQELLEQTRRIDPRVRGRAIWNQDLPSPSAARGGRGAVHASAANVRPGENRHWPGSRERQADRTGVPAVQRQHGEGARRTGRAQPGQVPSGDQRHGPAGQRSRDADGPGDGQVPDGDPGRWPAPGPRSVSWPVSADPRASQAGREPLSAQASVGESGPGVSGGAAGEPGGTEEAPEVDTRSWPARNPRAEAEPAGSVRGTGHRDITEIAASAEPEPASRGRPGALGADWRDAFLRAERESWQPKPAEPYDLSVPREPQPDAAHGEIEPDR